MEVLTNDFVVCGTTFDNCLYNRTKVLLRCRQSNLVLNWEQCCFMEREGKVFGHKVLEKGIEIDRTNINVIENLPIPLDIKNLKKFWDMQVFISVL